MFAGMRIVTVGAKHLFHLVMAGNSSYIPADVTTITQIRLGSDLQVYVTALMGIMTEHALPDRHRPVQSVGRCLMAIMAGIA